MSYKRAWMLVENMNAMFREPLVESVRGGISGQPEITLARAAY
jgi:molybdate transport system regulatory protein